MRPTGTLYLISAPSGGGKTSLICALLESLDNLVLSVSHTTRAMRSGEVAGESYIFVDQSAFESLIDQGTFLEHANVFGYYYGTSRIWVEEQLSQGHDVILEIDWQGAAQVKKVFPQALGIFLLPPALHTLTDRLHHRAQDDESVIAQRMHLAKREMSHYVDYDYLIINDDFDVALSELQRIVRAQRLQVRYQRIKHAKLIASLLD